MSAYMDMLRRMKEEKEPFFKNYMTIAKEIKELLRLYFKDFRVFVFGSVVKGNWNVFSDIDILIVSEEVPKDLIGRVKLKKLILERYNFNAPLEIHLATSVEFEKWYDRMIDVKIEI